jgi:maltose alpha-D-glucosyltransferase / alpha-amylase
MREPAPQVEGDSVAATNPTTAALPSDPLWYKTAIIYEAHVRAFCDANGDGIGDLAGLTSKLDYLQDLGITALWLLPFFPSPLRDGGYDIADYENINPAYGTMADFERLVEEAHARGIRVIIELVINHTSTEHAWFQRAPRAPPGSPERDFYVWSDTPEKYTSTRIIFKDFETSNWAWDPVAKAYYWHRFYSHQPDLNFDNPAVHEAVFSVLDFWFNRGVDGLRLDAVPYLFEREGTNCENLPETHAFLKKLRAHVDAKFQDRMLLAEANQWPVDAASYFGSGDECHMNFHFPLMPRMFMALRMEDRFPIVDILRQTPALPANCQWATFLRNHDELTLEMVTDEERDYMYKVYTEDPKARINLGIRHRLTPLLKSRRKVELMNALLFALPGTPVLYYGDEIGMGDNVYLGDRDGVRTPMQWSSDRNAGFSRANPQRLYLPVIIDPEYHYEAINVDAQQGNQASLLWWMKRLIDLRKQHPAFGRGELEFLTPENARILAFVRDDGEERLLVVANLSRFTQYTELDLSKFVGQTPTEVFGRSQFPVITERPYPLSLGPHAFYWFSLEKPSAEARALPKLIANTVWTEALKNRPALATALSQYSAARRWFRGKARNRRAARVIELIEVPTRSQTTYFVVVEIEYQEGDPEQYLVPVAFASGEAATNMEQASPHAVIAHIDVGKGGQTARGLLYDSLATGEGATAIMEGLRSNATLKGERGTLECRASTDLREAFAATDQAPRPLRLEQSNSTVPFGDRLLLKVLRQLEPGVNAELEVGSFLSEHPTVVRVPKVLGAVTYVRKDIEPTTVALAHGYVPNEGTAWDLFLSHVEDVFDSALVERMPAPGSPLEHLLDRSQLDPPPELVEVASSHLRHARMLGQRTAEVHVTLASGQDAAFMPEAFTPMYQQSLFQGARSMLARVCETLARQRKQLPDDVRADAEALLAAHSHVENQLRTITAKLLTAVRIRSHGDLHLGQVLFTGDDFVIIDFEGEPARPLRERRYKRNPLRDVAGMLRSFSYATESSLRAGRQRPQDLERLTPWARLWTKWIGAAYLQGYLGTPGLQPLVTPDHADRRMMLDFYRLEKCIYEVSYELNNRPTWLPIPVRGLLELVGIEPPPALPVIVKP